MSNEMRFGFLCSSILVLGSIFMLVGADPVEDKQALLDFIGNISHPRSLNWNDKSSVCSGWRGVTCDSTHSRVIELRLPGEGLRGSIAKDTLGRLSALQILSLRLNTISGSIPSDFSNLKNLTALYLQSNQLSGPLPSDFSVWNNLSILNLSNNNFNGSIPSSMANLTHLTDLILANNSLSGEIPNISQPSLQELDLANNDLTGLVPVSLQRFPNWAFVGNNLEFSNGVSPSPLAQPPSIQTRKTFRLSEPAILGIAIGACVLGFVLIALVMILCCSKKGGGSEEPGETKTSKSKEVAMKMKLSESQHDKSNKLVFFEGSNLAFDLEDLLRASAEVLGKGTFGSTYRAALEDSTTVVVKRVKEVSLARRDFEQQMEVVGNIRHDNVAPMRAYFYSKDEKLMVYDYYSHGSVSSLLHGKRGEGRTPLDWETRLRIAIGAARGLAHIHSQNNGKLVHGNIKASNIFLTPQGHSAISDVGLATLMNPMPPQVLRAAGYRAPEVTDSRKVSQASDIFSLGVFLLELLTGKSPIHNVGRGEVVHLVRWVNSVVREEWTAEVFDLELLRYPNVEEEMVEMLQIGLACVVRAPDQRPKITELVKMVEGVKRGTRAEASGSASASTSTSTPLTPATAAPASSLAAAEIASSSSAVQQSEIMSSAVVQSQVASSSSSVVAE